MIIPMFVDIVSKNGNLLYGLYKSNPLGCKIAFSATRFC